MEESLSSILVNTHLFILFIQRDPDPSGSLVANVSIQLLLDVFDYSTNWFRER